MSSRFDIVKNQLFLHLYLFDHAITKSFISCTQFAHVVHKLRTMFSLSKCLMNLALAVIYPRMDFAFFNPTNVSTTFDPW